jgi:glutamate-ammonia-ligase adenylyltransferase
MIRHAVENAALQLAQKYTSVPPLHFAVIGLGKLGTCELMIGSDLDVMFVYDVPDSADEAAMVQAHDYYNRLTARVIHLLSHPTKTGNLYEMDMKLRPYGAQSAVAVKLEGFRDYYANAAWVVEHLALIQGRIVYASEAMRTPMRGALHMAKRVDIPPAQLIEQMHDVRKKISSQHYSANPWDIKYVWGGLMDVQWIVKTLMAKYAVHTPLPEAAHSTAAQLKWLYGQDILSDRHYQTLLDAQSLFHCTLSYLRLCHGDKLDEQSITEGLQLLLTSVTGFRDFSQLKQQLLRLQGQVYHIYQNLAYM